MLEVTLNEQNMTAQVDWSWTSPEQYYSTFLGATFKLSNGDWMGDFGSPTHHFAENEHSGTWDFTDTGAVIVEVTPTGQVVRTITFPTGNQSNPKCLRQPYFNASPNTIANAHRTNHLFAFSADITINLLRAIFNAIFGTLIDSNINFNRVAPYFFTAPHVIPI
jgi:hypothetical protein